MVISHNKHPNFRISPVTKIVKNWFRCPDIKYSETADTAADDESAADNRPFPFI
jgi:hypothetical protein